MFVKNDLLMYTHINSTDNTQFSFINHVKYLRSVQFFCDFH